ncbi:LIM and SH3 domain protein Lasp [Portunus trituberculatus]|uniref:LIM and SH3 domain protein Lasp n=1 Tax=Portunus trituberculatus TaxID=210409 RepID=A0A5B7JAS2_PORTR|nr:LIM and SH3 domain protein Lasp [Portunus trituberculatus]
MSKRCARCEKAVYPLEELKCLDKLVLRYYKWRRRVVVRGKGGRGSCPCQPARTGIHTWDFNASPPLVLHRGLLSVLVEVSDDDKPVVVSKDTVVAVIQRI